MSRPDEGLIHAWLDGELDAAEAARVEGLVKSDPAWAAAAAEARGLIAASARIVSALDDVPAGVVPKRAPAVAPRTEAVRANRTPAWWTLRAAAAVVIVAGSAIVLSKSGDVSDLTSDSKLARQDAPAAEASTPPQTLVTDSVRPLQADSRVARVPDSASAPAPASAPVVAGGARERNERDTARQGSLADADVSARQQAVQDRLAQQQPLVQSQLGQQRIGAAGTGAGSGSGGVASLDSLQKKNDASTLKLAETAAKATVGDERRAVANRVVPAGPPAGRAVGDMAALALSATSATVNECYRDPATNVIHRVRRVNDSTVTLLPSLEREAFRSSVAPAAGAARENASVSLLRVRADTLLVPGANNSIARAVKISCPQP